MFDNLNPKGLFMNIFIDDSGSIPVKVIASNESCINCVVAVVMSDEALKEWERFCKEELLPFNITKGSDLKESEFDVVQILAILNKLSQIGVEIFIVETDSYAYSERIVGQHKASYINSMLSVTQNHPWYLRGGVDKHVKNILPLSLGQYLKTMLIVQLQENVIRGVMNKQQKYSEFFLADFSWYCDRLDKETWDLVKYLVRLQLNSRSQQNPVNINDVTKIIHLLDPEKKFLNVTKLTDNFSFNDDKVCLGVKAADFVANFRRRILRGRLQGSGVKEWYDVQLKGPYNLSQIHFNKDVLVIDKEICISSRSEKKSI